MRREQKLLTLLQISLENGWENKHFLQNEVVEKVQIWRFLKGFKEVKLSEPKTGKVDVKIYSTNFNSVKINFEWYELGFKTPITRTEYLCLDYLVAHFEEEEISFLEALCKDPKSINSTSFNKEYGFLNSTQEVVSFIREIWVNKPTPERLDKLFEIFNHLFV